jgi:hypothetical protein
MTGGGGGRGDSGGDCAAPAGTGCCAAQAGAIPLTVAVDRMGPGDHACLGFRGHEDRWAVRAAFTIAGLALGERVVLFTDRGTPPLHALARLSDHGVPAQRCAAGGRLTVSPQSPGYDPVTGSFDPDARTAILSAGSAEARRRGFTGMRVAADMSWAADLPPGQLAAYEADLTPRFARSGFTAICEYDRAAFPPPLLADMRAVHPLAVLPSIGALHTDRAGSCLRLVGNADLATRSDFDLALRTAFAADPPPAVLDLTPLSFLDAHCATTLLHLPPGTTLRCTPAQHRMLRICGADEAEGIVVRVE